MVLAVNPADADKTLQALEAAGEKAYLIGEVISGSREVILK